MKYIDKEKSKTAVFHIKCAVCNKQFTSGLPNKNIKVITFEQIIDEKFSKVIVRGRIKDTYNIYVFEHMWELSYVCPNCGYKHLIAHIKSGNTRTTEMLFSSETIFFV